MSVKRMKEATRWSHAGTVGGVVEFQEDPGGAWVSVIDHLKIVDHYQKRIMALEEAIAYMDSGAGSDEAKVD